MGKLVDGWTTEHRPGLSDAGRVVAHATAVFFIAAGVIHISAAADHENLPVMMAGFLVVATLQVAFGGLLLWRRPDGLLIVAALALMLGSVGIWLVSRTAGLPLLPGGHMEPIGFKDGVTVLFELASVPGLLLLLSPDLRGVSLPSPRLGTQALAFLSAGTFALFVPALVLGGGEHHSHDQFAELQGHEHGEEGHDGADAAAGGHEHAGDQSDGAAGNEHAGGHGHAADNADAELAQVDTHSDHSHGGLADGGDSAPGGGGGDHQHGAGDGHGDGGQERHSQGGESHGEHDGGNAGDGHTGHQGAGDGHAGHGGGQAGQGEAQPPERTDPPLTGVVTKRAGWIVPKPAGTRETVKLQYGPYVVPPGADASQASVDLVGANGFIVAAKPSMRYADGSPVTSHADGIHLHHAHLFRKDTSADDGDSRPGYQWVFGTGDEQTMGSFEVLSKADPRGYQYGVELQRGEPMLMVWMPMNMTDRTKVVYLEFEFQFVHGTARELRLATGKEYRPLRPVLYGSTFNVPKMGGLFAWPLDARRPADDAFRDSALDPDTFMTPEPTKNVQPGVGDIWTAPSDGELVGAAGHMHEGGVEVRFSDLGSRSSPCPNEGDRFPGTTVFESRASYPHGMFPTHLKMGTTQPGWRLKVRKGDRIAINGVYDTRTYAWPDQMSVVGFYYDPHATVKDSERCRAQLVNEPSASQPQVVTSVPWQTAPRGADPSRLFGHMHHEDCVADGCNDYAAPRLPRGPHTNKIVIDDFTFSPGDIKRSPLVANSIGPTMSAAPVVERGEQLTFVNLDFLRYGGTRHAVTSCHGPCNGPSNMTYPNSNGLFYSGPIGYVPLAETASSENQATPTWTLDTSRLAPGYYTYYCFHHRWMRGAFYVE